MAVRDDASRGPRPYLAAAETVNVLAAMVQFQPDTDPGTSGNGQFDLSTPASPSLDAPPRNRRYFLDHLDFLATYYRKVSKGKVIIRATLVDSVFTLGSQMARYSPPKTGPNTVVGDLARDTWQKVDSSGLVPDFSPYDCFVVFHAGVGRDVDVVAAVGFDPTPRDIPSLYLGLKAFKQFYGAGYEGIPVRNGFKITNTIVMPETETRELPATPSNVVLTLGINGLLCASVGNFLGLPDLFDTNTGRSGIGRFGLMDGQAIFSFRGAFPPEPSAWEKFWLGWIEPVTLGAGDRTVSLPAVSLADSVYRVPISASEYFLIENRNRDAGRDGQRVTLSYGGLTRTLTVARDTAGFEAFDISLLSGNVIDVEDFDWSLPGGVNTSGLFFDGGILIWHIDESVIAQGLASNGVNANPARRGVDVEEADGSQDIGQEYGLLEPGSGSEEGTALDFWYQGNASPVNRNEFSFRTYPNTNSNSGANSHITIKEFGARGPQMTARVIVGNNDVAMLPGFPKALDNRLMNNSLTVAKLGVNVGNALFVSTTTEPATKPSRGATVPDPRSTIYAWTPDGRGVLRPSATDGVFTRTDVFLSSASIRDLDEDGVAEVVVTSRVDSGQVRSRLHIFSAQPRPGDSLAIERYSQTVHQLLMTRPGLIGDSTIVFGGKRLFYFRFNGQLLDTTQQPALSGTVIGVSKIPGENSVVFTTASGTVGRASSNSTTVIARELNTTINQPAVVASIGGNLRIAAVTLDGTIHLMDASFNTLPGFPVNTGLFSPMPLALVDVDGDGFRDIVVFGENKIFAYNNAGAVLDNFPKQIPSTKPIRSNPVIADLDGDGSVDIVAVSEDGLVVAYDKRGQLARGFPLQAGTGSQSVAAFAVGDTMMLAVASSEDGSVTAWRTGIAHGTPNIPWGQYQRDAQHTGLAVEPLSGTPLSSAFFPKERAYNWPNPVYDGRTFIRYFVSENAMVKIKIFDLAGDLVAELTGPGIAGVDNEVEWKVGDVQSGIYLARIEAQGAGKTETAVVKVAVVK